MLYKVTIYEMLFFVGMNNGTNVTLSKTGGGSGCPYIYEWCCSTPKLLFPQFLSGVTLIIIGYAVASVIVPSLYSQVVGPFSQVFRMKCYLIFELL